MCTQLLYSLLKEYYTLSMQGRTLIVTTCMSWSVLLSTQNLPYLKLWAPLWERIVYGFVPSLVDLPMFLNVVLKLGTKLPYSRKFSHYFVCACSTYKNLNNPKFSMNLDLSTCGEDRIQEASSLPRDLCSVIQSKRLINLEWDYHTVL